MSIMKRSFSYLGGMLFTLTSIGCGVVEEQPIGDGPGGAGGSASGGSMTAGTSTTSGGSAGSGAADHGSCAEGCADGYGCYDSPLNPTGICAPLCDSQDQGQTPTADLSCRNSVRGGAGTCVFSQGYGEPDVPDVGGVPIGGVVQGLCSNECDPLAQDCPVGYTCDATNTYSAVAQVAMYACMPSKLPLELGYPCDTTGDGVCGPGLTCSLMSNEGVGTCRAFCDRADTKACDAPQHCVADIVTEQVGDDIGVCAD
jgi:hypothetical protein